MYKSGTPVDQKPFPVQSFEEAMERRDAESAVQQFISGPYDLAVMRRVLAVIIESQRN